MLFRPWLFNFSLNLSCFLHWLFYTACYPTICYTFSGSVTMEKKVKNLLRFNKYRFDFAIVCAVILDALKSEFEICGTQYPKNTRFLFWISDVAPVVPHQDTMTNCVTLRSHALMLVHYLTCINANVGVLLKYKARIPVSEMLVSWTLLKFTVRTLAVWLGVHILYVCRSMCTSELLTSAFSSYNFNFIYTVYLPHLCAIF